MDVILHMWLLVGIGTILLLQHLINKYHHKKCLKSLREMQRRRLDVN